jgi:ADP-L-glycero-D-manno-heptose 6-epimerase
MRLQHQLNSAMRAGPSNIQYVDMPESTRNSHQYFTEASIKNLRRAGYNAGFTPLKDAVGKYLRDHVAQADRHR